MEEGKEPIFNKAGIRLRLEKFVYVSFFLEPGSLVLPVAIDDIAMIRLKVPFRDDDEVTEPGPHALLDLAPYSTLPLHAISASHAHTVVAEDLHDHPENLHICSDGRASSLYLYVT